MLRRIQNPRLWVNFKTTVQKAASLLNTDFQVYDHVGTEVQRIRTLQYAISLMN